MSCGRPLDGGSPSSAETTRASSSAPPEERRQVTVLFADLSGYTAVAEQMDPERVKSLVERCLRRLGEEVLRYGGTIDKFIGDNVMALFGAPVAHEDDPERAVRAALGMQEAMEEINAMLAEEHGVSFELRVGINTGEVLAGAVGERYTVTGDTVNVASRLQSAGQLGAVTVGDQHPCRDDRRDRVHRASAADAQRQGPAGARLAGSGPEGSRSPGPFRLDPAYRAERRARVAPVAARPGRPGAAVAARRPSSGRPASARPGCSKSSKPRCASPDRRRCCTAAACHTARTSPTGRSARSSGPTPGSSTATSRRPPGRSSPQRFAELLAGGGLGARRPPCGTGRPADRDRGPARGRRHR